MKILVCTTEYPPFAGGIGNQVKDLVEELEKNYDLDIDLCSPLGPDIKLGSANLIKKTGRIGLLYYWNEVRKLTENKHYDIVWFHNPLFLKKLNIKSICTIHNTTAGQLKKKYTFTRRIYKTIAGRIERYALNKLLNKNNQFICISEQVKNELNEIFGTNESFKIISNAIDISLFSPSTNKKEIRSKYGIPLNKIVLIAVGRLVDVKQPLKIIKMHEQLSKNLDCFLVLVGDGPLRKSLENYVRHQKINGVKFTGNINRENLPEFYNSADYYVMASKYEGLPVTLLEAMSCGLPSILSDIPSLQIAKEADCGFFVDFDKKNCSGSLYTYVEGSNQEHSIKARSYALENLDISKIAEDYHNVFKQI